jgi:hypothetical protein
LREELLRLYAEHLATLGPLVCGAPSPRRREAAHKLKGASLAIGAFALARICDTLENEAGGSMHQADARQEDTRREKSHQENLRQKAALTIEITRRRLGKLLRACE